MLMEKALDKQFWHRVQTDPAYVPLLAFLRQQYDSSKLDVIPALSYRSRMRFYGDGDRTEFERPYFRTRRRLAAAAILALIYPEEPRYIEEVQELIWAICDEYSWALPAHTNGSLEDDLSNIDLFNAETGFTLTEICYLLSHRLDDRVRIRAEYEIRKRIVVNYENHHYSWETVRSNWASVCAGNVGGVLMYLEPEKFRKHLPRLLKSMDCLVESFASDGTCLEGIAYWCYGFGNYVWFADLLYQFTQGEMDILQGEKITKMAGFMERSFLKGGSTVSFSDGTRNGKADLAMQHYLTKKFPGSVHLLPAENMQPWSGNVLWMQALRTFLYFDPELKSEPAVSGSIDLPDAGQVMIKKEAYALAVKAGHNDEPHNHNDVGSFIFATDEGQILCDYGSGRYTRQYFHPVERYNILINASFGHSVPILDGQGQKQGKQYAGTIAHEDGRITVALSGAYAIPGCRNVTRVFSYQEDRVTVTDTFDTDCSVVTDRFVTMIQPELLPDRVVLGNSALLFDPEVVTVSIREEMVEYHVVPILHTLYCMDFTLKDGIRSAEFTLLADKNTPA